MKASMFLRFGLVAALSLAVAGCNCGGPPGTPDAGDSGTPDAGDSGTPDGGKPDSGTPDSGTPDSGTPDSGTPDSGTPDSGTPDSGTPDGGGNNGVCQQPGQACVLSDTCCSGSCRSGVCSVPMFCGLPGATCTSGLDCCSNFCEAGQCSQQVCRDVGQTCSAGSQCCTGVCNGTCQALPGSSTCKVTGQSCFQGSDCCSTNCQGGMCVRAFSCQAYNDICYGNADCCSGVCSATGGGPGRCTATTGATGCTQGGNPCADGNGCCTRVCLDLGTGAKVCQPVGGCQVAGDYCDTTASCCGGQPVGTVVCESSILRCDNGQACRAPGTICGKPTVKLPDGGYDWARTPDGGQFTVNNETNCCNGYKLPGNMETTCRVDRSGVPRCFGGAGVVIPLPDGGTVPPGDCPNGYTGEAPCCIALGDVCQFRDQCCNGALCIPPPEGGPSRCTISTCDPVGTVCDPAANNCCAGTECLATSELTYACMEPSTTPDAGPPPCQANGTTCGSASVCCSEICTGGICVPPASCQPQNATCTASGDCCSGLTCVISGTSGTCQPGATCSSLGQACSATQTCCSGLACLGTTGMPCNGTSACSCDMIIN